MTTIIFARFTAVGHWSDIQHFSESLLVQDLTTGTTTVHLAGVCPINDEHPSEAWGPFTQTELVSYNSSRHSLVVCLKTDGTIKQFIHAVATQHFPHLSFLLREVNFTAGFMERAYYRQGAEDQEHGAITVPIRFVTAPPACREAAWSHDLNAWVSYREVVDAETQLSDHIPDQLVVQEEEKVPAYAEELIPGLDNPSDVNAFLHGLGVVLLDQNDEDFHVDGVSYLYEDDYESFDSYDGGSGDEEDYGGEEDDEDANAEHVTIAPLLGSLEDGALCSICITTPIDPQITSCSHVYCSACINSWLAMPQSRHMCPNCKRVID